MKNEQKQKAEEEEKAPLFNMKQKVEKRRKLGRNTCHLITSTHT
jgi:hypothetical protein